MTGIEHTNAEHDARRTRLMKIEDKGHDNNYHYWASCTKDRLEQLDIWKYIEGPDSIQPIIPTLVKPRIFKVIAALDGSEVLAKTPGNEDEVKEALKKAGPWRMGDLSARTLLKEAIPAHRASAIGLCVTAKDIWIALREEFAPANESRAADLHQKVISYVCTSDLDVEMWVENLRNLHFMLVRQSPNRMSDTEFASVMANLLPTTDAWRGFNTTLANDMAKERLAGLPMRSAEVIRRIRQEYWAQHRNDTEALPQIHTVEDMRGVKRSATVANLGESSRETKRHRDDKWCSNSNCNRKKGHTIEECLAYGGGKCGQYPEWWTWRRDIHLPPQKRQNSGKPNNRNPAPRANVTEIGDITTNDTPTEVAAVLSQNEQFYSFNTFVGDPHTHITCNTFAFHTSTANANQIYHDSGANRHIFFNRSHFDNYREIEPLSVKGFESSVTTSAVGVGDVLLRVDCNGTTSVIKLSDVLHVPSARLNLVSQGCLARRGMSLRESNGRMTLFSGQTDIVTAQLTSNNLYRLDAVPAKQTLQERIAPPSLASRISGPPEPAVFKARAGKERQVSSDFYTA